MPHLFDPLTLRSVRFRNRVGVAPMCQYSAGTDGIATDWHLAHLGARAVGGAGLVIAEATAVEARGRISPADLGIWDDAQVPQLARIAAFIEQHGAVSGIQIAHAGRKAGTAPPFAGGRPLDDAEGGWNAVGASAIPFSPRHRTPEVLTPAEIGALRSAWVDAAVRARSAGFRFLELHAAHGYLLHSFLSPLSNERDDDYGGAFENRARFLLEVVRDVREVWPTDRVLAVRISSTDWVDGGWTDRDTVALAKLLEREGIDVLDCSSGGSVPTAVVPTTPGYQIGFAEAVKRGTNLHTAAVGLITTPTQANEVITTEQADLVLLGRELLRNPHWPLGAAKLLGKEVPVPPQYARAF
ncbi:MAG: NADH:flavin oxidoreductase/NADH oxidase [Polyangiales bacterium]